MASRKNEPSTVVMRESGGDGADFANYFSAYASLYHQKQMLTDHTRMQSYHEAIMGNADMFQGKVVLDVGTGSGILALWAAKAGAKKVYAVEMTDMAKYAKKLLEKNGVGDKVQVIQSSAETLELPEKVDIIVSEWMGYFLLRESMLDSLIRARDQWLKPGGAMFPSHASMVIGVVSYEQDRIRKQQDYLSAMQDWLQFKDHTRNYYDVDMGPLESGYEEEQMKYYLLCSFWSELCPSHVIGEPSIFKTYDMHTCTLEDVQGIDEAPFRVLCMDDARMSGFAGWFTVEFNGSEANPCSNCVTLSTSPEEGTTHWGQQVFYLQQKQAQDIWPGCVVEGKISLTRQTENVRLYDVTIGHHVLCPCEDEGGDAPMGNGSGPPKGGVNGTAAGSSSSGGGGGGGGSGARSGGGKSKGKADTVEATPWTSVKYVMP